MSRRYGVGRRVAELFFTKQSEHSDTYLCRCGTKRKRCGTSYQNLLSHVQTAHPDHIDLLTSDSDVSQERMDAYFKTSKSAHIYGWIGYLVNGLLPFSHVQKPHIRKHIIHQSISLTTFKKYLHALTESVEHKITSLLPTKFSLVFDGWSCDTTHYLCVFASFPADCATRCTMRLLSFSPMGDELQLDTQQHIEFLTYVLDIYGKSWKNVVCLVGENCSTNKSLSTKCEIPLIGCCSHRFNLAVVGVLSEEDDIIQKVNSIIVKLRTILHSARLRKLTELKTKSSECNSMEFYL